MSSCYLDYTQNGITKTLALTATTSATISAPSTVPTQIVESGYEVSDNVINKEYKISFTGIISSSDDNITPEDYLNSLYLLRDSKQSFRTTIGNSDVVSNFHPDCRLANVKRSQNSKVGIVGGFSSYEVTLDIVSIRTADLASVIEASPDYVDLKSPKQSSESNTVEVDESKDEELYRKAQVISTNNNRLNRRGGGGGDRETDVDVIYSQLVIERDVDAESKVTLTRQQLRSQRG